MLMDGADCSLVHQKKGARRGPHAPMHRGVCDGLRLPCGAALAHLPLLDSNRVGAHTAMCAGRVLVLFFNIITIITIYISHGGCRHVYAFGRLCVFFGSQVEVHMTPML